MQTLTLFAFVCLLTTLITRRKTVFPGLFEIQRLRIESSLNGHLYRAHDDLGNTVFLSTCGAVSNKAVSAPTRTPTDPFEDRNLRGMDRIVYWQPMQKRICTTQLTNGDSVQSASV